LIPNYRFLNVFLAASENIMKLSNFTGNSNIFTNLNGGNRFYMGKIKSVGLVIFNLASF